MDGLPVMNIIYEGRGLIVELNEGNSSNIFNHFTGHYLKENILKLERDMLMQEALDFLKQIVCIPRWDERTRKVIIPNHQLKHINQYIIDGFTEPLNDSRGIIVSESVDGKFIIHDSFNRNSIDFHLTEKEMLFFMDELARYMSEFVAGRYYKKKLEDYEKKYHKAADTQSFE